jgi:hypothetical protein
VVLGSYELETCVETNSCLNQRSTGSRLHNIGINYKSSGTLDDLLSHRVVLASRIWLWLRDQDYEL